MPVTPLERMEHLAIADRDGEMFARWLSRCEESLRLSLRSFARVVDVEAIVQETALRVWQSAPEIRPDGRPECLLRWAVTVARNLARDGARRSGREVPIDERNDLPAPVLREPEDPFLRAQIQRCRAKLPPKPAAAICARVDGAGARSDRTLAELTGMSFDAFRQNLARARRLLEECLERAGIDVRRYLA